MRVAKGPSTDQATTVVVASYVVVAMAPFVLAAIDASFWEHEHSTAPVATGIAVALLLALLLRHQWA